MNRKGKPVSNSVCRANYKARRTTTDKAEVTCSVCLDRLRHPRKLKRKDLYMRHPPAQRHVPNEMSHLDVDAALCLWGAISENEWDDAPWVKFKDDNGAKAMRDVCTFNARACSNDWHHIGGGDDVQPDHLQSFDYDFCWRWLIDALDWTNVGVNNYPTIRPIEERMERLHDPVGVFTPSPAKPRAPEVDFLDTWQVDLIGNLLESWSHLNESTPGMELMAKSIRGLALHLTNKGGFTRQFLATTTTPPANVERPGELARSVDLIIANLRRAASGTLK